MARPVLLAACLPVKTSRIMESPTGKQAASGTPTGFYRQTLEQILVGVLTTPHRQYCTPNYLLLALTLPLP